MSEDQLSLQKYIQQLMILSRLRNLEDETDQTINDMPITKDKLHLRGVKAGEEKAERKAEKRAEKIAREQVETTQREVAERMLMLKKLTVDQIAEIAGVSVDFVQEVQRSIDS